MDGHRQLVDGDSAVDTVAGFRAAMDAVYRLGWECQAAVDLLSYARRGVVRPAVAARRLYGDASDDATSAGWLAAWEALRSPGVRTASSPWGCVRTAVNQGIQGAYIAKLYRAAPSTAWRRRAAGLAADPDPAMSSISLDRELENGHDFPDTAVAIKLGRRLESICAALVSAGWQRRVAEDALGWIASNYAGSPRGGPTTAGHSLSRARTPAGQLVTASEVVGRPVAYPSLRCPGCEAGVVAGGAVAAGRTAARRAFFRLRAGHRHEQECELRLCGAVRGTRFAAAQLHIPEWQLRRLALVVAGGARHIGLLELMMLQGPELLQHQVPRRCIRATACRWSPCPSTALAQRYGEGLRSRVAA